MVFWAIIFNDIYAPQTGYLVWTDSTLSNVFGMYFENGTVVPVSPPYGYTTTDTAPTEPAWGSSL